MMASSSFRIALFVIVAFSLLAISFLIVPEFLQLNEQLAAAREKLLTLDSLATGNHSRHTVTPAGVQGNVEIDGEKRIEATTPAVVEIATDPIVTTIEASTAPQKTGRWIPDVENERSNIFRDSRGCRDKNCIMSVFLGRIREEDTFRIPGLQFDKELDKIAYAMEKFYERGMTDCNIVLDTIGFKGDPKDIKLEDKIDIALQIVKPAAPLSPEEDFDKLITRAYTNFADHGEAHNRLAEAKLFETFEFQDYAKMARDWAERRKAPAPDDATAECFASVMMERENRKPFESLLEWKNSPPRLDVYDKCGRSPMTENLQLLGDILLRPTRTTFIALGPHQLAFYNQLQTDERQLEFEKVLNWNICHPYVNKVYLVGNSPDDIPLKKHEHHPEFSKIVFGETAGKFYHSDTFEYCTANIARGRIVMIPNRDNVMGAGWEKIRSVLSASNNALSLSRLESVRPEWSNGYLCCANPYGGCNDAIVFTNPLPKELPSLTRFSRTTWGSEDLLMNRMCATGLKLTNPCYDIRIHHYHLSAFRPYLNSSMILYDIGVTKCAPSTIENLNTCC